MSVSDPSNHHRFTVESATPPPCPPPVIPDYNLLQRIGRGSYGEVWLARNALGSLRAVKIVSRGSFDHDKPYEREFEGLKRFESISHARENQVDIYHVGRNDTNGFFYYIMELADSGEMKNEEGRMQKEPPARSATPVSSFCILNSSFESYTPRTLKHELRTRGPLPVGECVQIAISLTRALEHLHAHGLVHRDVKPSNIIFVRGIAKLADIGLVSGIDATRSFVGTEGYIPPEGPGAPQADLYSLGKVLYELVTGNDRLDFPELPADWRTRPDFEQLLELNEIVNRACDWDTKQRYADATQLRQDLERLQKGQSIKAVRIRHKRVRLAWRIGTAGLGLILSAVVAVVLSRLGSPKHYVSPDPEANRLYADAHLLLQQNTFEQAAIAYSNLTNAVRRDPKFLDARYLMYETCWTDWGDKMPPLYDQVANQRLIVSNLFVHAPKSVQYHAANADLNYADWHFERALKEAALAVRCDPTFLRAHGFYGWISLITRGDVNLALHEFKAAERINSEDRVTQLSLGVVYYFQRQYQPAIAQFERIARTVPNNAGAHFRWGRTCEAYAEELRAMGENEKARHEYIQAIDEDERFEFAQGQNLESTKAKYDLQRKAFKENGAVGWYQARLDYLKQNKPGDFYDQARMHARLGRVDEALEALEEGWRSRDGEMAKLLEDDCWDPVRERPEFKAILRKMDLRPVASVGRGKTAPAN